MAAGAAVSLAACGSEAAGVAHSEQFGLVLRALENERRAGQGRAALSEEDMSSVQERVFELKLVILRIVRFDLTMEMPPDHVDGLVGHLLAYLPGGAAALVRDFRLRWAELGGNEAESDEDFAEALDASALKKLIAGLARRSLDDMLLSMGPLLAPPSAVAAGAVLAAMQVISSSRSFATEELLRSLAAADRWLDLQDVRRVFEEWGECRKGQGKPVIFA